jgi:hypothetical protein
MRKFDFGAGPVPAHKHKNGGGWVAFVGPDARVYDNAQVCGNALALVCGHTRVYGNARIFNVRVYGSARVYDKAPVCGNALALVCGHTRVYGEAQVFGEL